MRRRSRFKFKPRNKKKIPAAAASPPSAAPPWSEMPLDVTANILQRLGAVEILRSAQKVCATWRKVCQDPAMWRVINIVDMDGMDGEYTMMCRRAVDRSQGQLIDLTIEYFGDDELLGYIADRSSHLRRLTLASCYDISGTALTEAVKKLLELEELHLIMVIPAEDIETIGISCPLLKSFTFNQRQCKHPRLGYLEYEYVETVGCNERALAIGKSMPNLYHLQIFANGLNNEGLQAILDGCPHLESLDLRKCFRVDLGGALGKRCCEQIKHVRFPLDSIDDYEWDADEFSEYSSYPCWSVSSDYGYDSAFYDYNDPFVYDYEYYDD